MSRHTHVDELHPEGKGPMDGTLVLQQAIARGGVLELGARTVYRISHALVIRQATHLVVRGHWQLAVARVVLPRREGLRQRRDLPPRQLASS